MQCKVHIQSNQTRSLESVFEHFLLLYHIVGSPTVEAFKAMLKGNVIKNCPITAADVDIAEKIYGPAISTLKGKTTRKTPKAVVADEVLIPQELLTKH